MFIKDGFAYAGDPKPILCVLRAQPLDGHALKVKFNDGTQFMVDMSPLITGPVFSALQDQTVFNQVYVEHGIPMWCDGEIDIAPEWLREHGCSIDESNFTCSVPPCSGRG